MTVSYTHLDVYKRQGQEGRYQISSTGRLRRMPRYVKGKNGSLRRLPMQMLELTSDEVKKIKRMLEEGEHVLKIAEEFKDVYKRQGMWLIHILHTYRLHFL